MTEPDHLLALGDFAEVLGDLGLEFHVGGSVASSVWGRGRSTFDVDVSLGLEPGRVEALAVGLQSGFYVDAGVIADAVKRGRSFNVIHLTSMVKIDAFPRTEDAYDRAAIQRVRLARLSGEDDGPEFPVSSPEDIILRKLRWFRSGGEVSERQWADVLDVLRVQRDRLDREWMEHWSGHLGIADLLERALVEAGLEES